MEDTYDDKDPVSIEAYGKRLLNRTLRTVRGQREIPTEMLDAIPGGATRGKLGEMVESYYYGVHPGNDSVPDFTEAGVELKTTPIKQLRNGAFSAKERLVLNIINYKKEAEHTFEESSFSKKNSKIMLMSYLHTPGMAAGDYPFKITKLLGLEELPVADQEIIKEDWSKINQKIRLGKAHELSEGDTLYLGACTKGADGDVTRTQFGTETPAKPRAYSFKGGFMTMLVRRELAPETLEDAEAAIKDIEELKRIGFEKAMLQKASPFVGTSVEDITASIAPDMNPDAKGYFAALARRMLGVKKNKVEELEKADVMFKIVRLKQNGYPKEAMSFRSFRYKELADETWEDSRLFDILRRKFLLFVFQYDEEGALRFKEARFWTMPTKDLEDVVRPAWEEVVQKIKNSDADGLIAQSDDRIIHVRTHGRDANDTDELPNGKQSTKKCFWLNQSYIQKVLES